MNDFPIPEDPPVTMATEKVRSVSPREVTGGKVSGISAPSMTSAVGVTKTNAAT
jgi:hypothetical protein